MTEKQYSLSEAANILGVSNKTLRNWDNEGKIESTRTAGGHRRISEGVLQAFQLKHGGKMEDNQIPKNQQIAKATMGAHIENREDPRLIVAAPLRPAVSQLADAKNQDEVIDFTRQIIHEIEDTLNARVKDDEYALIERTIFDIHARGIQKPPPKRVRPGYLNNIIDPIHREE